MKALSLERRTVNKVRNRIVPFIFFLYIIAYIDRANIGYAALDMNESLGLTSQVFGLLSGIFFIGYFFFEVPSNILMERFGPRKWIARILITWGIVSAITAFANSATHLYIIRFLLGVAEAGFYPGIILYLTYWVRGKERAGTIALFMTAVPLSYILGGPLSTWIMDNINWMGMDGWRWMFLLEALPAVIMGFVTYFYLTDKPSDAKWLSDDEKKWLINQLETERKMKLAEKEKQHDYKKVLKDKKVWFLSLIHFVYLTGNLGVGYWMPQIVQGFSDTLTNTQIGLISTIPYIAATLVMNLWSRHSDRTGERVFHSSIPLFIGGFGLLLAGFSASPVIAMILITVALAGMYSFKGPFWSLSQLFMTQATIGVGIAVINSVGNLGGFLGPYAVGLIKDSTGSAQSGLFFLSASLILGGIMAVSMRSKIEEASLKNEELNIQSKNQSL
jgi:MFS family permease